MTVTLSPEMEGFVTERIGAGEFQTPFEVVEEALMMLQAQEDYHAKKAVLIADIQVGLDSIKAGRVVKTSAKEIADNIRSEMAKS
jgi:antitoxin ParD1/3/4